MDEFLISQLLQNQIEFNSELFESTDISSHRSIKQLCDNSSQIITNLIHSLISPSLVRFECSTHQLPFVYRTRLPVDLDEVNIKILAHDLAMEIDQMALRDIEYNAGLVAFHDFELELSILQTIETLVSRIKEKTGEYPNWIVAPPEIIDIIKENAEMVSNTSTGSVTILVDHKTLIDFDLYEDTSSHYNRILIGRKDDNLNTYSLRVRHFLEPHANQFQIKLNGRLYGFMPAAANNYYGKISLME